MTLTSLSAVRIHQVGEADVLQYEQHLPVPTPGADEVLVKTAAIGVNYIDVYMRTGLYQKPLPCTLGLEGAGTVEKVGDNVREFKPGDRVAWFNALGSYATHVIVRVDNLVHLPDKLSFEQGASALLQGITAQYLTQGAYWLKAGETCLVHAAAGGVGLLLCQVAKMLGARVIGTVSTPEKAELAHAAGADEIILYTQQDFVAEVNRLTHGEGVHVVYDAVGKDTFMKSLECLRLRGMLVSYGQASGPVPQFDIAKLSAKSLFLTRASLFNYTATRAELVERAQCVFDWLLSGRVKLRIEYTYPLAEVQAAHRALTGHKTTGKVLLIP